MHKSLSGALIFVGLFISLSAVAEQFSFQEPPTEQSLVRPGDEPQQQPPPQPSAPPAVATEQPRMAPELVQEPEADVDNAFYLKPTYVSQETFNSFKGQVVEVLKDTNAKSDALSQEVLDMKIQVQPIGPQMASLKQMMTEIATLVSAQPGLGNIWKYRWFMAVVVWSGILTLFVLWLFVSNGRKKRLDSGADKGSDYDYLPKEDSLPSHLNLAQTYMTMKDYARARKSLEFVIINSKDELRTKAMQLLKQLPKG